MNNPLSSLTSLLHLLLVRQVNHNGFKIFQLVGGGGGGTGEENTAGGAKEKGDDRADVTGASGENNFLVVVFHVVDLVFGFNLFVVESDQGKGGRKNKIDFLFSSMNWPRIKKREKGQENAKISMRDRIFSEMVGLDGAMFKII